MVGQAAERGLLAAARRVDGVRHVRRPLADAAPFDLSYARTGPRGRTPVLVVPGGPGLASILPYAGLRRRAARRGLDLVMVEHRGVGLSRRTVDGADLLLDAMRIDAVLDDLVAVLDAEGIERAVVYGASYGSYLAAGLATRHADRLQALVLDSPLRSVADQPIERELVRSTLWRGEAPGTARSAAAVRRLVAPGADEIDVLANARAAYELGGPELLARVVGRRLARRGTASWRLLRAYAGRDPTGIASVPGLFEFDLVGAIAFRELRYAPDPDGAPFDATRTYGAIAHAFPSFEREPFDLDRDLRALDLPTAVLTGRHDLRTAPAVARRVAGLVPGAVSAELDNGHSALESHPAAALHAMERAVAGRAAELPGDVPRMDALPRQGAVARFPALVRGAAALDGLVPRRR